jgi:uncharacterized damage-inducible protein DinB
VPSDTSQLLFLIDTAYDRASWHGTNLRGSIRGVSPRQAAWRPGPGRHNVWELVVHAAYWKYAAWRRLTSARRGSFPLDGSNWFARPQPATLKAWRADALEAWDADVALLEQMHRMLRGAIADLRPRDLDRRPATGRVTKRALVTGVAAHDLYHAGQIQLLKRLAPR